MVSCRNNAIIVSVSALCISLDIEDDKNIMAEE